MSREAVTMEDAFRGFTAESFAFFRDLARNNNKLWFNQNRSRYDEQVVGAMRGLLQALEPGLLKLNPHFETSGKAGSNLSRINRDIRFSKDKTPYKSNFYLRVHDSRREEGRLYVGLSAECVTVGFAIYGGWGEADADPLRAIFRKRLASHAKVFRELLDRKVRRGRYETYWHRKEKNNWAQHPCLPRSEQNWLTLHAWIVRKVFLPGSRGLSSPAFAKQVERIWTELYPLWVFTSSASPRWKRELAPAS
jgi:uncharacterized protein (TIGR02453 family)